MSERSGTRDNGINVVLRCLEDSYYAAKDAQKPIAGFKSLVRRDRSDQFRQDLSLPLLKILRWCKTVPSSSEMRMR